MFCRPTVIFAVLVLKLCFIVLLDGLVHAIRAWFKHDTALSGVV